MFNKFENKRSVVNSKRTQTFKGFIKTNSLKFQVNNFDEIICFRFNIDFVKQFLALHKESCISVNDKFTNNLIDDFAEIVNNENECFITDDYHMGKYSDVIYLNLNNKFLSTFRQIINEFPFFPPAFLKFKDIINKIYFFPPNINKAENF